MAKKPESEPTHDSDRDRPGAADPAIPISEAESTDATILAGESPIVAQREPAGEPPVKRAPKGENQMNEKQKEEIEVVVKEWLAKMEPSFVSYMQARAAGGGVQVCKPTTACCAPPSCNDNYEFLCEFLSLLRKAAAGPTPAQALMNALTASKLVPTPAGSSQDQQTAAIQAVANAISNLVPAVTAAASQLSNPAPSATLSLPVFSPQNNLLASQLAPAVSQYTQSAVTNMRAALQALEAFSAAARGTQPPNTIMLGNY